MYNVIKHFFSLDMAPETNVASLSELRFIVTVRRLAAITYSEREMLCTAFLRGYLASHTL